MATITPVSTTTSGTLLSYAAATGGGDTLAVGLSGAKTILHVRNGAGSPVTVTLTGVVPCSQGATHNKTYSVTNGTDQEIEVPPQVIDPSTGNVAVGYSSATSVTVAASVPN